jgi:hypothetical protein
VMAFVVRPRRPIELGGRERAVSYHGCARHLACRCDQPGAQPLLRRRGI